MRAALERLDHWVARHWVALASFQVGASWGAFIHDDPVRMVVALVTATGFWLAYGSGAHR